LMSAVLEVAELVLRDGTQLSPVADGMTVFVGPNNSEAMSVVGVSRA